MGVLALKSRGQGSVCSASAVRPKSGSVPGAGASEAIAERPQQWPKSAQTDRSVSPFRARNAALQSVVTVPAAAHADSTSRGQVSALPRK